MNHYSKFDLEGEENDANAAAIFTTPLVKTTMTDSLITPTPPSASPISPFLHNDNYKDPGIVPFFAHAMIARNRFLLESEDSPIARILFQDPKERGSGTRLGSTTQQLNKDNNGYDCDNSNDSTGDDLWSDMEHRTDVDDDDDNEEEEVGFDHALPHTERHRSSSLERQHRQWLQSPLKKPSKDRDPSKTFNSCNLTDQPPRKDGNPTFSSRMVDGHSRSSRCTANRNPLLVDNYHEDAEEVLDFSSQDEDEPPFPRLQTQKHGGGGGGCGNYYISPTFEELFRYFEKPPCQSKRRFRPTLGRKVASFADTTTTLQQQKEQKIPASSSRLSPPPPHQWRQKSSLSPPPPQSKQQQRHGQQQSWRQNGPQQQQRPKPVQVVTFSSASTPTSQSISPRSTTDTKEEEDHEDIFSFSSDDGSDDEDEMEATISMGFQPPLSLPLSPPLPLPSHHWAAVRQRTNATTIRTTTAANTSMLDKAEFQASPVPVNTRQELQQEQQTPESETQLALIPSRTQSPLNNRMLPGGTLGAAAAAADLSLSGHAHAPTTKETRTTIPAEASSTTTTNSAAETLVPNQELQVLQHEVQTLRGILHKVMLKDYLKTSLLRKELEQMKWELDKKTQELLFSAGTEQPQSQHPPTYKEYNPADPFEGSHKLLARQVLKYEAELEGLRSKVQPVAIEKTALAAENPTLVLLEKRQEESLDQQWVDDKVTEQGNLLRDVVMLAHIRSSNNDKTTANNEAAAIGDAPAAFARSFLSPPDLQDRVQYLEMRLQTMERERETLLLKQEEEKRCMNEELHAVRQQLLMTTLLFKHIHNNNNNTSKNNKRKTSFGLINNVKTDSTFCSESVASNEVEQEGRGLVYHELVSMDEPVDYDEECNEAFEVIAIIHDHDNPNKNHGDSSSLVRESPLLSCCGCWPHQLSNNHREELVDTTTSRAATRVVYEYHSLTMEEGDEEEGVMIDDKAPENGVMDFRTPHTHASSSLVL